MLRRRSQGLDRADWLALSLSLLAGCALSFTALEAILNTFLEPKLIEETALRTSRSVRLVETALEKLPPSDLPPGVIVRPSLEGPEGPIRPASSFDHQVHSVMASRYGVHRALQRDRSPYEDSWGGTWIRLQSNRPSLWLYQPDRLSTSCAWFLPFLRGAAVLMGLLLGTVFFLKSRLEQPFQDVLLHLPVDCPTTPLPLLPVKGVAPLRLLSLRINQLLARLNATGEERRQLLRGIVHDLAGPQTRICLQVELLQGVLKPAQQKALRAIHSDLNQLAALSDHLGQLTYADQISAPVEQVDLEDLIRRVVSSYVQHPIHLQIPRLQVRLNGGGLERALRNLIDNALHHGKPPVTIQAWADHSSLVLEVQDQGEGPAATLGNRPQGSRRGLGLAIVERFCHEHQGRLLLMRSQQAFTAQMHLLATPGGPVMV
ncbi:MAG: HAMP domain-containing sensor histidine kinase [Cyanobacteriota bacterium]|nr:HAMP domain-containing sensor histidine kinase [Cyanobacteriota bacterium]